MSYMPLALRDGRDHFLVYRGGSRDTSRRREVRGQASHAKYTSSSLNLAQTHQLEIKPNVFWHAVVDGFCGALSTASTFTSEFRMLKEAPHAPRGYVYAAMMLLAGQVAAIPFVASIPSM